MQDVHAAPKKAVIISPTAYIMGRENSFYIVEMRHTLSGITR